MLFDNTTMAILVWWTAHISTVVLTTLGGAAGADLTMAVSLAISKLWNKAFLKKPLAICVAEEREEKLERNLSLTDLLAIGIGGTVGSGVFVLAGLIAHDYAGPGVVWSWLIAGAGCTFSAMSYAEMSCRIPSAGSSYAYVFHGLGELPAVIAAWCLCLEYGISGSAVARSWGEKIVTWTKMVNISIWSPLDPGVAGINIFAGVLQAACVGLLLLGVEMGKMTVNFFTILKMILVLFMIIAGLWLFRRDNVQHWTPKGMSGVFRGATSAFFGYLGYDEVCCLAAEAKNPHHTLPIAVFGTIGTVTVLYALSSLALVGMMPYKDIDSESGFSEAFKDRDWYWAQHIVAVGEIVTLPLVVLISFLAQPRLQYALAEDGLLPKIFSETDGHGNLRKGIIISGILCILVALFIPFTYLNDMISAGVLLSFNLTNSSLICVRRGHPTIKGRCKVLLGMYNILALISSLLLVYCRVFNPSLLLLAPVVFIILTVLVGIRLARQCPEKPDPLRHQEYRVPWMPFCPLFGIFVNYFLVAQLSWEGLLLIILYFGIAVAFYFSYSIHHSVGNRDGWADLLTKLEKSGDQAYLYSESGNPVHGNSSLHTTSTSLEENLLQKSLRGSDDHSSTSGNNHQPSLFS